jgi:hypothetical protein
MVPYSLRRNLKTNEIAIACPLCDVEAAGGTEEDVQKAAERVAKPDAGE